MRQERGLAAGRGSSSLRPVAGWLVWEPTRDPPWALRGREPDHSSLWWGEGTRTDPELARSLSTCCLWPFHPQARETQGRAEAVAVLLGCPGCPGRPQVSPLQRLSL